MSSKGQEHKHIIPSESQLQHRSPSWLELSSNTWQLPPHNQAVPTGVVDDSKATLSLNRELGPLLPVYFSDLHNPPILCTHFALSSCTLLNSNLLLPSSCHYSHITTHHNIIHTSPHIIPCYITHLITSCHTTYFITPTPTHCIPNHWRRQQPTVETFGLIIFLD